MVKIIFVCLFLNAALGCDDNGGDKPQECFPFLEVNAPPNFLDDFNECPTDGFTQICNLYGCFFSPDMEIPGPPALQAIVRPMECEALDCFNMECELFEALAAGSELFAIGLFTIEEILGNSNIVGSAMIDNVAFDFQCSPIVP